MGILLVLAMVASLPPVAPCHPEPQAPPSVSLPSEHTAEQDAHEQIKMAAEAVRRQQEEQRRNTTL